MILSFKTKINGKPTLFIEKIWEGLFRHNFFGDSDDEFNNYLDQHITQFGKSWDELDENNRLEYPKIHTIRKDEKNRWKVGTMIDFFINTRTKDMFRFAPRIQLKSKQRIFMTYLPQCGLGFRASINGRELEEDEIEQLAFNDGFDAVEDFEDYFIAEMENDEYSGKILHWTDFKY